MARQHLYLMARRLPDMRRSLVDLRLKVDDKAEVLVRRTRRAVTHQDQALRLATSRLFLLSPRRTLTAARQRLDQAAQMLGQSFRRRQTEPRRHLEYMSEPAGPAQSPGHFAAGLCRGHPAPPGNGDSGRHPGFEGRGRPGPGGPGPDGLRSGGSEQ